MRLGDHLVYPGLHNGTAACFHGFDLAGIQVDTQYAMAFAGETGGSYGSDVSKTKNADRTAH
jgi:hypothetical protein